jgi:hypothetical protein
MFQALVPYAAHAADLDELGRKAGAGDQQAAAVLAFAEGLDDFAFSPALARAVTARGGSWQAPARSGAALASALHALLAGEADGGLGVLDRPKGLLAFHRHAGGVRTAFEEHLAAAAELVRDGQGTIRVHFTISAAHRERFAQALAAARPGLAGRGTYDVSFSEQAATTDTVAAETDNRPFRTADGALLFRPGGHGALLHNLAALGGDVVFIKNIDNVVPEERLALVLATRRMLAGVLLELEADIHDLLRRLRAEGDDAAVGDAVDLCRERLGLVPPSATVSRLDDRMRHWVIDRLARPLRVCGVVPARGEPGGGPFWVRDREGQLSRQIVEQAEMDLSRPEQRAAFEAATHFNPVDLVCSLRDEQSRPYPLEQFVDHEAVFLASKSAAGRELKALELPGLWNGGMARWNTLFVEVPAETFAPVKTVLDLLRPEHR